MARHKRQQPLEDAEPALDISSLIDVCFLLLIYFLVTSTIKPRESDLGLQLPGVSEPTTEQPKIEPMLIFVEESGGIYVGQEKQAMDMDGGSTLGLAEFILFVVVVKKVKYLFFRCRRTPGLRIQFFSTSKIAILITDPAKIPLIVLHILYICICVSVYVCGK